MRILQVTEPLQAGVGRHVVDVARGLAGRGHEVHVAYSPVRVDPALEEELLGDGRVAARALVMRREPHFSDVPALARLLARLRRDGPFDVIHAHSSKAGALARIASLASTAAMVYTPHAFATMAVEGFSRRKRLVFKIVERTLAGATDALICGGETEWRHAREVIGVPARRLTVIQNALSPEGFRAESDLRAELGLPRGARLVGMIGRLESQKGVDLALRALAGAKARMADGSDVGLAVLGEGAERGRLSKIARESGIDGAVFWLGWRRAREHLHNFDVVLAPSRYESAAYAPREALHCGVPVVCTEAGAAGVVRDGESGIVLPNGDVEGIAEALARVLEDKDLRAALAKGALAAAERFTLARMLDLLEQVYWGRPRAATTPEPLVGGKDARWA